MHLSTPPDRGLKRPHERSGVFSVDEPFGPDEALLGLLRANSVERAALSCQWATCRDACCLYRLFNGNVCSDQLQ